MRQRPGAGGWEKKRRRLGTPGQRKLNRCWSKRSWIDGHKTEEAKLNTYSAAVLNLLAKSTPYGERSRPLAEKAQPPDLVRLTLVPSSLSSPTHVETSPRPMMTRNRRGREADAGVRAKLAPSQTVSFLLNGISQFSRGFNCASTCSMRKKRKSVGFV